MYEEITDFIKNRIAQLRIEKNISASKMSEALGNNRNYINQIENGVNRPSLEGLTYILEYFNITAMEFFNDKKSTSLVQQELINYIYDASQEDVQAILNFVKRFK